MLNNANVLTQENPVEAERLLRRLKDLLQYQFDDSNKEEVKLTDDITFLTDYLQLEKVRRDNFQYIIQTEIEDPEHTFVPPLLFIPFVENAVKHGNDARNPSYVSVSFRVKNRKLEFSCLNSRPAHRVSQSVGGLGLSNIRRRLDLLYPDKYELTTTDTDKQYSVKLHIYL